MTDMRMMPISMCQPGMRLAKSIFSDDGIVLLAEGVELTTSYIRRLHDHGIRYLYVQDPRLDDVWIPEPISEETRRKALNEIRNAFREFAQQPGRRKTSASPYIARSMRQVAQMIVDDLSRSEDAMIMLMNMHTVDHYLYAHSLNVCIYATILGIAKGYSREELYTYCMGALLHDIGKTQISMDVLLKPGKLTKYEYEEMKRHAERGFYLLKDEPGIPLLAAHCALQHHERLDGTGYPRGLKGSEIHEYARLIGIVDSYDAMTSYRVYRDPVLPHVAVENLYAGSGTLYDTDMLQLFRDKVAIYPIGITVELRSGQIAVVVDINAKCAHRPVVRVLTDEEGQPLKDPYDIDLSKQLNITVSNIRFDTETSDIQNQILV
jgi:HD-GYP domain-containing protein (c-di-GMP phosphodiesterase class II)